MENSQETINPEINKEIKRHKSAHISKGSESLNKILSKGNQECNDIKQNLPENKNPALFKIKSNSIFAYQEFDRFSSFCDNGDNEEKNIQSEENNNKDEYNNISTSFSIESRNSMKRKSLPNNLPQYIISESQNEKGPINLGILYPYEEFIKNNLYYENIRRRNTQKVNRNNINIFLNQNNNTNINNINNANININLNNNNINNTNNNLESFNNFEKRKKSRSLYFREYNNNNDFNEESNNKGINIFQNNIFINNNNDINKPFPEKNLEDIKIENTILPEENDNLKNNNDIYEEYDFPLEYNGYLRKKSNSLTNNIPGPMNQINFPFQPINNNFYNNNTNTNNQNNSKTHKFLSNKNIYFNHKKSNIFLICQDQSNCRNLQDQLDLHKNDINYIQNFVNRIKPNIINIMTHQFGNYVIQKLFEILIYQKNKTLINELVEIIDQNDNLYKITINNYGTRVIQKTLEKLIDGGYIEIKTPELNNSIKNLIAKHLLDLCKDKNGNHVYQKILKVFQYETEENNNFLYEYLSDISIEVSLLQQGATIFATALQLATYNQKEKICKKIIDNLESLINNQYGNYSVQQLIKNFNDKTEKKLIDPIYSYISKNIVDLSNQKFSSNVIDAFIIKKDDYSKLLISEIIKNNQVKDIIKDQYGNYVIQKAISISDTKTLNEIIDQIKPIVPELLESNIGKKVLNKLSQQYNVTF